MPAMSMGNAFTWLSPIYLQLVPSIFIILFDFTLSQYYKNVRGCAHEASMSMLMGHSLPPCAHGSSMSMRMEL